MTKVFLGILKVFQLLIAVWAVTDFVLGFNGCYDHTWTYHGHSHSCFKLFGVYLTWEKAREKCECHETSKFVFCQKSWLAKIDDEQTNNFVKGLLRSSSSSAYIGLYKVENRPERWIGFNEVPKYHDFDDDNSILTSFYTRITKTGWIRTRGASTRNFVCQTDAENEPMKIKCPSPLKISQQATTILTFICSFDFTRWKSAEWTDASNTKVAECDYYGECRSLDRQMYTVSMSDDLKSISLSYRGEISRELEGVWGLAIFNVQKRTVVDERSCDLKVYEPAENISCVSEVTSCWVLITCITERVYPDASCFWKFKYRSEHTYVTPHPHDIIAPESNEYRDELTGHIYFRTQCQVNLTRQSLTFKAGTYIVKVRMSPNVGYNSLVPTADRRFEKALFDIEKPGRPVFKFTNDTIIDNGTHVVSFSTQERMGIVCQIPGGKPEVYQTTMSCTFNINGAKQSDTSRGNQYTLDMEVVKEMNRATCTCWGHHLTTPTTSAKIQFEIWFPSEVISFSSNPRYPLEGQGVTLECRGIGQPEPDIYLSTTNKYAKFEERTSKQDVSVRFTAECSKMGRYQCMSENIINGDTHKDIQNLDLVIKCPPTTCEGHQYVPSYVIRGKGPETVTLCAMASPLPDKNRFELYKDLENGTYLSISSSLYFLELKTEDETLKGVAVMFYDVTPSDLGAYKLYYPQTDYTNYTYLKFNLTSKAPVQEAKSDTDYTLIGVGIFLGLCLLLIIAVVIVFILWRRKKRREDMLKPSRLEDLKWNPNPPSCTYNNQSGEAHVNDTPEAGVNGAAETAAYDALPARDSNVYSNDVMPADRKSSADHVYEDDSPDNLYNNCPQPQLEVSLLSQQNSSRKRKQKELVYVDVIIDPASQRPELQEVAPPPSGPKEEPVNYVFIDPVATRAREMENNNDEDA